MSSPLRALVASVYLPSLVFSVGQGLLNPVLVLASLSLGFSEAGASAVVGVFGLVGVFASPVLGRVIARAGDRPSLIAGSCLALASLCVSIATLTWPGWDFAKQGFVISLVFLAVAGQVWSLGRQAYIADNLPPLWRARGLSTLGGMIRLGMLLGPLLATGLLMLWTARSVFILTFITSLIALAMIIVYFAPEGKKLTDSAGPVAQVEIPEPPVKLPNWPATAIVGTCVLALSILRSNKTIIIPLWGAALGLPDHTITLAFGMSALIDSALFYPAGKITDRRGRLWSLIPALFIMSAGILTMLAWQNIAGFFLGAALMGLGNGFGAGIVMTLGADLSPPKNRATFLGIWNAVSNTGSAAGPYVASGATAIAGVSGALWASAGIGLLGMAWTLAALPPTFTKLGMNLRGDYIDPRGDTDE